MNAIMIGERGQKTFVLVFDKGDEVIEILTGFAKEAGPGGSPFTAIGAFHDIVLGYFDRERKDYKKIPINEQVEVLSLVGNIAINEGAPKVHAHVIVGKSEALRMGATYWRRTCGRRLSW